MLFANSAVFVVKESIKLAKYTFRESNSAILIYASSMGVRAETNKNSAALALCLYIRNSMKASA